MPTHAVPLFENPLPAPNLLRPGLTNHENDLAYFLSPTTNAFLSLLLYTFALNVATGWLSHWIIGLLSDWLLSDRSLNDIMTQLPNDQVLIKGQAHFVLKRVPGSSLRPDCRFQPKFFADLRLPERVSIGRLAIHTLAEPFQFASSQRHAHIPSPILWQVQRRGVGEISGPFSEPLCMG